MSTRYEIEEQYEFGTAVVVEVVDRDHPMRYERIVVTMSTTSDAWYAMNERGQMLGGDTSELAEFLNSEGYDV